jgi:hypothetical protein
VVGLGLPTSRVESQRRFAVGPEVRASWDEAMHADVDVTELGRKFLHELAAEGDLFAAEILRKLGELTAKAET